MIRLIRRLSRRKAGQVATPAPVHIDPFAGHPVQCKCYFHR